MVAQDWGAIVGEKVHRSDNAGIFLAIRDSVSVQLPSYVLEYSHQSLTPHNFIAHGRHWPSLPARHHAGAHNRASEPLLSCARGLKADI